MNTLKDKLALSRRAHIAEAALAVFAAKGYHRATIRDVAYAAGVADGTIYASFANKEALLLALLDPLDELAAAEATPPDARVPADVAGELRTRLTERFAALTPQRLDALRVVLSEVLVTPDLRALFLDRIVKPTYTLPVPGYAALHAAGQINAPDPAFTARALTASMLGFVMLRLLGDPQTEKGWGPVSHQLADLLLDGLMPRATTTSTATPTPTPTRGEGADP